MGWHWLLIGAFFPYLPISDEKTKKDDQNRNFSLQI